MKIFDCFMYFDEEILVDLRLNYLNNFVDQFVIVESQFTHSGKKRNLLFNLNKFNEFKHKIEYLVIDHEPPEIETINDNDDENTKSKKYILNAVKRENYQRNFLSKGLDNSKEEDIIIVSDVDEIPKIENINFNKIKNKFIFFQQKMFYYKFNLCLNSFKWYGSKACKKKHLISPQWLRNIKDRSYPFWRLDTFFSKNKKQNIYFINDGGWHFSYLKSAEDIEKKLKSYLHHREYDIEPIGVQKIKKMINEKRAVYNLKADMRSSKFSAGQSLAKIALHHLPNYIQNNINKYKEWLE